MAAAADSDALICPNAGQITGLQLIVKQHGRPLTKVVAEVQQGAGEIVFSARPADPALGRPEGYDEQLACLLAAMTLFTDTSNQDVLAHLREVASAKD